jgi:L-threonylcarbamoyladenylate synthase
MTPPELAAEPATIACADLTTALAALRAEELVVYPTETFYGIAADPSSARALERIFELKGRSPDQPIAMIAGDAAAAWSLTREIPPLARRLAASFWPGPLTLVLPARPGLHDALCGPDGVGVRVTSHPLARRLATAFGGPITATSANLTGYPPIREVAELRATFQGKVKVILEDGMLTGGAPSTVLAVSATGYRIIRAGAVSAQQIAAIAQEGPG